MSKECEHRFVHLRNESWRKEYGYRGWQFVSVDYFFCDKCLTEQEIKKEHFCNQGNYDERPDWCKTIKSTLYE
jgi:hypothetical protein